MVGWLDEFRPAGRNEGHKRRNCEADRKSEPTGQKNIMDARVSPAHTFQLLLHTPLPYGLVPINNAAFRIYRWPHHWVPHICGMPWPHSCSSVPHTMQTAPLDWCNQAPSTKHCGRFFPNSSAYFTYWPLLPAFRCHNARSSLYLTLYSGVKILASFHQMKSFLASEGQYTDCSLNQIWKCILFSRIIKRWVYFLGDLF